MKGFSQGCAAQMWMQPWQICYSYPEPSVAGLDPANSRARERFRRKRRGSPGQAQWWRL